MTMEYLDIAILRRHLIQRMVTSLLLHNEGHSRSCLWCTALSSAHETPDPEVSPKQIAGGEFGD